VLSHPPTPCVVHPLPAAPAFVGRQAELEELRRLWRSGPRGVIALIGLGGAGKTAVAARFLLELQATEPRPAGLFVWSFYQEPDPGLFLRQAYAYFAGGEAAAAARGAGLLHLLRERLQQGGPHLLVLDGLERVQRQGSADGHDYGKVEDPLLRGLLTRLAEGGGTTVLVTSRFPLTDLASRRDRGYRHVEVDGLDPEAAVNLLRHRGVRGDDATLAALVEHYGAHALTLDHLGGLLGQFRDGDPARAPDVLGVAASGGDRQAFRLARLLRAYEEHLPEMERALLCRLCLLRRSVTAEQVAQLFLCSPPVHARTARELLHALQHLSLPGHLTEAQQVELAEAVCSTVEDAQCHEPLAGPEATFRQEVVAAVHEALKAPEDDDDLYDYAELARTYAQTAAEMPTDRCPLPARDRARLQGLLERLARLYRHPFWPSSEVHPALEAAFQKTGFALPGAIEDVNPHTLVLAFRRLERQLCYLAGKHWALRRVREICRHRRQRWSLAVPLASLDLGQLLGLLDALVSRHLVLREADGSYSVHPAVRDHFHRLASTSGAGSWHRVLRDQLVNLARRPGVRLPEDPVTLDLVEEAVYHALQAGQAEEAFGLYNNALGGLRHLGWKLGEMARGLRILCGFNPYPDPWALAWYLRALGELEEAHALNPLASFRADVRLLQGRLPQVAAEGDDARTAMAAFLMGESQKVPPTPLGCVVPRQQALLYLGRYADARRGEALDELYGQMGWEADRARCQLVLAEAARRQADPGAARDYLQGATAWVLHSGSVEHLGLFHVVRARAARFDGDTEAAQRAVDEGIHLTRHAGLGLYLVELLCEQAELCLARADAVAAAAAAAAALERAAAPDCRFRWGEAEAGHLLGRSLAAQERSADAQEILKKTLALRCRLGDPKADETESLLRRVCS
jgi:hypothetical protein